jgi:hypothetical protein
MPKTPKKSVPPFLAQARTFYAEAFAHHRKDELAEAMAEWTELDETEQSFALAHLAYLDLEAQAVTHQLLGQVRDLLDELAEAFTMAVEASLDAPAPEATGHDHADGLPFEPAPSPAPDIIDAEPIGSAP